MGAVQPKIGNFEIPVSQLLYDRNNDMQKKIDKLQDLTELLVGVMSNNVIPDYSNTSMPSEQADIENQRGIQLT